MAFKVDWKALGEQRDKDKRTLYVVLSGDKSFGPSNSMVMKINGQDEMVSGDVLYEALVGRILSKRKPNDFDIIVRCGDNAGVDELAQRYCERHGIVPRVQKTNWDKGGKAAGYRMCEDLFVWISNKEHTLSLLLWDGRDLYTRHAIWCTANFGVPVVVYNYVKREWFSKDEIQRVQEEVRMEQLKYGRWV